MTYKIFQPTNPHGRAQDDWSDTDMDARYKLCEIQQPTQELLLSRLPQSGIILESGCGVGRWVKYLSNKGFSVVGLDNCVESLLRSHKTWNKLLFVGGDVLKLPFRDESVASVVSLGLIEHFEEGPGKFLSEIKRILKPGGVAYLSSPYESPSRTLFHRPAMMLIKLLMRLLGKKWVFTEYRYSRKHLKNLIESAGFSVSGVYPEDLTAPDKDFALHVDWLCIFRAKGEFGLNLLGKLVKRIQAFMPKMWSASALLFVCRKPEHDAAKEL